MYVKIFILANLGIFLVGNRVFICLSKIMVIKYGKIIDKFKKGLKS